MAKPYVKLPHLSVKFNPLLSTIDPTYTVIPAEAGIQGNYASLALDPRFRGGDNFRDMGWEFP
jgi:hypothetical protein